MIGIVTVALLYMTVLNVFARVKMPEGMDVVALLFAGLFALPSVRGVMPGDPPFGELYTVRVISGFLMSL